MLLPCMAYTEFSAGGRGKILGVPVDAHPPPFSERAKSVIPTLKVLVDFLLLFMEFE